MNQELYNKLIVAFGYCKEDHRLTSEINEISETIDGAKEEFFAEQKKKKEAVLTTASVISMINILVAVCIIAGVIAKVVVFSVLSATVFVGLFILERKLTKIYRQHDAKTEEKWKNWIDVEHAVVVRHLGELCVAREKFRKEFDEFVEFIPAQYRNLQAVSYFLMMVQDERADSMKEAMRMYDEQVHRWKMESAAARTAQANEFEAAAMLALNSQQAQANQYLKQIRNAEYIRLVHDVTK